MNGELDAVKGTNKAFGILLEAIILEGALIIAVANIDHLDGRQLPIDMNRADLLRANRSVIGRLGHVQSIPQTGVKVWRKQADYAQDHGNSRPTEVGKVS